jgi:hypothetical protein
VRSPAAIAASLCLGLALGGCSLTSQKPTTPANTSGPAASIGTLIDNFKSDGSSANETKICNDDLSSALKQALNAHGGCKTDITNQLASVSTFTLTTTKGVEVSGNTATAVVQSTYDGKTRNATLHFIKQPKGGWRISGIS